MGKAGKWFKSFLTGKKDQKACNRNEGNNKSKTCQSNSITSMGVAMPRPSMPKEKRRWSFRRSSACASAVANSSEHETGPPDQRGESDGEKHALEVVTKDGNMEVLGAKVVDEVEGVSVSDIGMYGAVEVDAALKIQSIYRSCLARTALRALRGLVKLQALIRGHMVRKQATTTLKCMQALITAQVRARTQRIQMMEDGKITNHTQSTYRRNTQEKIKHSYHDMEENIKIVEMDNGEVMSKNKSRNNYSVSGQQEKSNYRMDNRISNYYSYNQEAYLKKDYYQQVSPTPSAITDMSPRIYSGYLENYSFSIAQSSPQCFSAKSKPDSSRVPFSFLRPDYVDTALSYDYPPYPNYMANTESSKAKARSQSAPKQRPEFERQPSRGRRASIEGKGIPKSARMQRSSSHVGSTTQTLQYPWSNKLNKSTISLKESECGSTCSVLTNTNYCKYVVSYDPRY